MEMRGTVASSTRRPNRVNHFSVVSNVFDGEKKNVRNQISHSSAVKHGIWVPSRTRSKAIPKTNRIVRIRRFEVFFPFQTKLSNEGLLKSSTINF